jgi:serine phosphatase RsbU (regulator of sigma subunit)
MKKISDINEKLLRKLILLIAIYSLVISISNFIQVFFVKNMTTDDCLWTAELNNLKLEKGLFISEIITGGVAENAGLKEGDILIAINGKDFKNTEDAMNILNSYKNEYVTYTIQRNGILLNVKIYLYKFFDVLCFIFSLLGFGFLVVAFLVGYSKPKEHASFLFFLMGSMASAGISIYGNALNYLAVNSFSRWNTIIFTVFFHPLFLHFFLTYPIKYQFGLRKKLILSSYIFILALTVINILIPQSKENAISIFISRITIYILISYIVAGIITFFLSFKNIKDTTLKKSLKIILFGFIIGMLGFAYYMFFQFILRKPIFLINYYYVLPIFLVLSIPVSFGISIFKYRILDTEFIVKKGLVFGIITILIIGGYLIAVYILDAVFSDYFGNKQMLSIMIILIVIFTFDFVNTKAKEFVDRQFYRERYNYRKSLLKFSREITYYSDINSILEKIIINIKEIMTIRNVDVWITDKQYKLLLKLKYQIPFSNDDDKNTFDRILNGLFYSNKEPVILEAYSLHERHLSEYEIDLIKKTEIILSVPIFIKEKMVGTINFSSKLSGKAYSDEDIDLLKTIALQCGIAIENSRLRNEEIEKQKIEKELYIARDIQNSLLPASEFNFKNLEVSCSSKPATYIGGDFCDYIKLNDNELLIVVADVCGKGIPAALYMTKVQTMIQFASKIFSNPKDILVEINKQIYEQFERNTFVTVVIAKFNTETKTAKFVRAGHNPPLYFNGPEIKTIYNKGIGLGLENKGILETNLDETVINYKTEDIFIIHSDGLTEAMDNTYNEFGLDKLKTIISKNSYLSSKEIKDEISKSVDFFRNGKEQNDDITYVIIKIKK